MYGNVIGSGPLKGVKQSVMNRAKVLFLLFPIAFLASAWISIPRAPSSQGLEFDHTTVHVRDLQKSAGFYEKVLGLERIPHPFKDTQHVWFRIGPHQQLHMVGGAKEVSQPDIEVHFAFRVTTVTEFAARLDAMQVKYRNFAGDGKVTQRPDGVHQIYFQDPDGYWIEVNDDRF
jgi:lactoylglutathione lyase